METFLMVCAGLFLLVVGAVSVFLIQTLIQVRKTARSVEILTTNLNQEVLRLQNISHSAANLANMFTGTMGRTVSLGLSLLAGLVKKNGKKNGQGSPSGLKEGEIRRDAE